jgi:hypothetical protein
MSRFVKHSSSSKVKSDKQGTFSLPAGTTADRPSVVEPGEFRFNTTTNLLEYFDGSEFKSINSQGNSTITQDSFTGDGSTVAFTMSKSVTSNQTQRVVVAVGNVYQNPASAYSLSGTTITFTSAPGNSETVTVIHGYDSNTSTS